MFNMNTCLMLNLLMWRLLLLAYNLRKPSQSRSGPKNVKPGYELMALLNFFWGGGGGGGGGKLLLKKNLAEHKLYGKI